MKLRFALLRGVCQTPAYVMRQQGMLEKRGHQMTCSIAPTAWMVPERLASGDFEFAVIPWTRIAAAPPEEDSKVICGSGCEEAALVVRTGLSEDDVRSVAVPREGGMKDLTAMALLESVGWQDVRIARCPSGDGAILAFAGGGADAASMVEPWATMLEGLGLGHVVRRTGDIWPGAPCCSLCVNGRLLREKPEVVQAVVDCYVQAGDFVRQHSVEAARQSADYMHVSPELLTRALSVNLPDPRAISNQAACRRILDLMKELGYIEALPTDYSDLSFLERALAAGS